MFSIPKFEKAGGCSPWLCISKKGRELFVSENIGDQKGKVKADLSCGTTLVSGDIRIDVYHRDISKVIFNQER